MGYLTQSQLDEVWASGLKDRIGRLRNFLKERGLLEYVTAAKLQDHVYEILETYFVRGAKEIENGPSASKEHGDA
jgi:hypothetical protein